MHALGQLAFALLRSRRGRKTLLWVVAAILAVLLFLIIFMVSAVGAVVGVCQREAENATDPGGYVSQDPSPEALSDIPENYLAEYRDAAEEYGIDWAILAAVGKIESDHNRIEGGECPTSDAGARGPMQFMPGTWSDFGIDANGSGEADICDYEDAIPSAASYLVDGGAPDDYEAAIFQYNRADWYVDDVLEQAEQYRAAEREQPEALETADDGSGDGPGSDDSGPASPGGTGNPPQGWHLVGDDRNLYYELDTVYAGFFEDAAQSWNALGGVNIAPSPSPEETDVVVVDEYIEDMGVTRSDGTIAFNPTVMGRDTTTDTAREAVASHEIGHALGYEHTDNQSVMQTPIISNSEENATAPTDYDEALHQEAWGTDGEQASAPPAAATGDTPARAAVEEVLAEEDQQDPGDADSGQQDEEPEVEGDGRAVFPMPEEHFGDYTNDWGFDRPGGNTHEGTDVFGPKGTPLYAIVPGTVVQTEGSDSSQWSEVGGYNIMVESDISIGPIQQGDRLYYAHLDPPGPQVSPGDRVEAGDVIGPVGSTGYGPEVTEDQFEPHLHLGWYDETGTREEAPSGAMNPYPLLEWLKDSGGTATGGYTGDSGSRGGGGLAPGTESVPAYCYFLGPLGLLGEVGEAITGSGDGADNNGSGDNGSGDGGPDGSASGDGPANPGGSPLGDGSEPEGTATGEAVVEEARQYLGTDYVLGGWDDCIPGEQMDCTCLTATVFAEFGYDGEDTLPMPPTQMMDEGVPVEGEPRAGDVHVWDDPGDGTGGHVAIDLGNGEIIHANMGTMDTSVTPMWDSPDYLGARRLVD